jgi:hypothetical protein
VALLLDIKPRSRPERIACSCGIPVQLLAESNLMKTSSFQSGKMSRKTFLNSAALAAVALPSICSAAEAGSPRGRRIGFVDDNLNNYHANVFLQALRGPLQERGWTVAGCTGLQEQEGRAWAAKNNVPWFADAAALNEAVDAYMVLAPSTPDTHLELCQAVLPHSKATYVDKTFAPDLATAEKIFALADQHQTPIQTTSALRYTNVQDHVQSQPESKTGHMITWGGGGSFDEYAIHPLELLISVMGPEAISMMRRGPEKRVQLLINFTGERTGTVQVYTQSNTPFAASITSDQATQYLTVDVSKIFVNNMRAVLDFFEAGQSNIDRGESLTLMRLLDAARNPAALGNFIPLA